MDTKHSEELSETLKDLKDMIQKKEMIVFTPEQAGHLVELADFWVSIKGAITVANAIGGGLKWCLMFIALWVALQKGLFEWVKAGLGK